MVHNDTLSSMFDICFLWVYQKKLVDFYRKKMQIYFHHFKDQKGLEEQLENLDFYPKLADIT